MAPPRRPTHDALHLGSGDFRSASASLTAIPPAPGRLYTSPSPPGVYPAPSNRPVARHAATPLPPHSLSPVAMGAAGAMGTGPQPVQREMIIVRTRPSFRLGMSIVLAGAILGGSIGVAMRARQDASEAAFAARVAANPTSPPLPVTLGPGGSSFGALSPAAGPQSVAPAAYAAATTSAGPVERDKKEPKERRAQHVIAKPAVVAHASPSPKAPIAPAKKDSSKNKDDEGWTIASAGESTPPPPPATRDGRDPRSDGPKADAKDARSDRSEARESRDVKGASKKGASAGKNPDDANAVLKAAMGATENTL